MNLTFLGAGYVGLTSGAVFADLGNKVWVVRRSKDKVAMLARGEVPFFEPGLAELVARNVSAGRLIPTVDYAEAIPHSEVIFISVGTPMGDGGGCDLSQVFTAARTLAPLLSSKYTVIVDKSTVPPGTAPQVAAVIREANPQANFEMVSCPEFLREGSAVGDTQQPERIVVGADSDKAFAVLAKLHEPLGAPIVRASVPSAELIKYTANAYLALRIGFIDQVANLCEAVGADIEDIVRGIGLDPRIGSHYWHPGIGYGGYCFPKDVQALAALFGEHGEEDNFFSKLDQYNQARPGKYVSRLGALLGGPEGKTVGVWGLTAKPGTDDVRGSQAVAFIETLQDKGAKVRVFDPLGMDNARKLLHGVTFCEDPYEVAADADALAVLCEWGDFAKPDWGEVKKRMRGDLIFDAKRMFPPSVLEKHGFRYLGVGCGCAT